MATAATPVVTNNKFTNLEHQVNRQPEIWLLYFEKNKTHKDRVVNDK